MSQKIPTLYGDYQVLQFHSAHMKKFPFSSHYLCVNIVISHVVVKHAYKICNTKSSTHYLRLVGTYLHILLWLKLSLSASVGHRANRLKCLPLKILNCVSCFWNNVSTPLKFNYNVILPQDNFSSFSIWFRLHVRR